MIVLSVEEFAAKRKTDQTDLEADLFPDVADALARYPAVGWYNDLLAQVARAYTSTYHSEGGKGTPNDMRAFLSQVRATLDKTESPDDNTVDRVSTWLATAILNAATMEAASTDEEFVVMEWVTMHDDAVRETHASTDGQQRPPGESFDVAGVAMRYPGDPSAPIAYWINCRCALLPTTPSEFSAKEEAMTVEAPEVAPPEQAEPETPAVGPVPWYGVLAPEGVWSGDGRRFAENSLRFRDLPLPLTWQKSSGDGHAGSVVVAKIEQIARVGNEMRASGHYLATPEADEAIGLVAEFGRFGVSVDADDVAESPEMDESGRVTFSSARIASASMVSIPAFAEAFVALGEAPQEFMGDLAAALEMVSDKPWSDFSQGDYTDAQWKAACVLHLDSSMNKASHKLPIKEPGGALNRNGVHAAAARFNQTQAPAEAKAAAKSRLRGAYSQLGEEPPDVLKASLDEFGRGPGWITNPKETKRIHDYWTKPGEEGYAKIGWGTDGDFNRCRVEIGSEIAEEDPEKAARFINQICAQWHHDATGAWPGHAPGETRGLEGIALGDTDQAAPALSLVASAPVAPAEWFTDPHLSEPTPLTVTDEGRVYGHIAAWDTCHISYPEQCVTPPHSETDYAYFLTGEVLTDAGRVPVGQITVGGGHAPHSMSARAAVAHYDSTSTAAADVTCGDDEHGIWVAGWVRPGATDEQVYAMRAAGPSGDWRRVGRHPTELVAAHCVNVQGFPIPRTTVGVKDGVQISLVAAGVVGRPEEPLTLDLLASMVADELTSRRTRSLQMSAIAARVWGSEHPSQHKRKMAALAAQVGGSD